MRKIVILIISLILLSIFIKTSLCLENEVDVAGSKNILYVGGIGPGNYTKIQDAINYASEGDTIFVYDDSSPYFENVVVDKSINVIGENKNTTIIDGKRKDDVFNIKSEDVIISSFTITNGSRSKWYKAGIRLSCSNNTLCSNNIKGNMLGVFGKRVTNITIFDNHFISDGITFSLYDNETESVPFCEKYFIHNIYNNVINGKKLCYYKYQKDFVVPDDAGQVIAVSCTNMTISDVNLTYADYGCILVNCSDCLIEYSNISSGDGMMWLIHSNNNKIQYNQISYNFEGICIDCESTGNIIKYNTVSNSQIFGIIIEDNSNFNTIYRNNFINNGKKMNVQQAYYIFCYYNIWKRNYWDRPRFFPYPIFGKMAIGSLTIPWVNFDKRPALRPYEI